MPHRPDDAAEASRVALGAFTKAGYRKGRSRLAQALWFATQNLVFSAWWLPPSLRPAILRAFGAKVGRGVFIRHRVRILWPWKLTLGDDCWLGEDAWLLNLEPVTIENDVCVSQGAFLCAGSHRVRDPHFGYDNGPITIRSGTWIGARATVLRGVTVGANSLVAAGAVLDRDLNGNMIYRRDGSLSVRWEQ